jgi:hypothetical protein
LVTQQHEPREITMEPTQEPKDHIQPLVEFAPEETVLPALMQSAHPIEYTEANPAAEETAD